MIAKCCTQLTDRIIEWITKTETTTAQTDFQINPMHWKSNNQFEANIKHIVFHRNQQSNVIYQKFIIASHWPPIEIKTNKTIHNYVYIIELYTDKIREMNDSEWNFIEMRNHYKVFRGK